MCSWHYMPQESAWVGFLCSKVHSNMGKGSYSCHDIITDIAGRSLEQGQWPWINCFSSTVFGFHISRSRWALRSPPALGGRVFWLAWEQQDIFNVPFPTRGSDSEVAVRQPSAKYSVTSQNTREKMCLYYWFRKIYIAYQVCVKHPKQLLLEMEVRLFRLSVL